MFFHGKRSAQSLFVGHSILKARFLCCSGHSILMGKFANPNSIPLFTLPWLDGAQVPHYNLTPFLIHQGMDGELLMASSPNFQATIDLSIATRNDGTTIALFHTFRT